MRHENVASAKIQRHLNARSRSLLSLTQEAKKRTKGTRREAKQQRFVYGGHTCSKVKSTKANQITTTNALSILIITNNSGPVAFDGRLTKIRDQKQKIVHLAAHGKINGALIFLMYLAKVIEIDTQTTNPTPLAPKKAYQSV